MSGVGTIILGARYAHRERSALERLIVEVAHSFLGVGSFAELNERKPERSPSFTVRGQRDERERADYGEVRPQLCLVYVIEVAKKARARRLLLSCCSPAQCRGVSGDSRRGNRYTRPLSLHTLLRCKQRMTGSVFSASASLVATLRPRLLRRFAPRHLVAPGRFRRWRRAESLLFDLNLPQAVRCNLLLKMRTAIVQQLLKVLFRSLQIVLGEGLIPQANFFSHA